MTIRRMIVFGVCALGVSCLYLAPSLAGTPDRVSLPAVHDESAAPPAPAPSGAVTSHGTTAPAVPTGTSSAAPSATVAGDGPSPTPTPGGQTTRTVGVRVPARAPTADDKHKSVDNEPPTSVTTISPAKLTHSKLTISWPPAQDDTGVVGYRIWLSGFEVATTVETHATIRWFNDDSADHVVQVRALDAAGNQSTSSPNLVVTRPGDGPAPQPTQTPSPTVAPTDPPAPAESSSTPEPSTETTNKASTNQPQGQSTADEATS